MDYEKLYNDALKRAKQIKEFNGGNAGDLMEHIFPELRESEDEKMRAMAIKAVYSPEAQSCIKSWGINPDDVIAWLEKQGEKKPVWSEEDDKMLNACTEFIGSTICTNYGEEDGVTKQSCRNWLKSFKDRVLTQPKQEWSEEDEKFFTTALWHISNSVSNGKDTEGHCATTEWLKSLKDRVYKPRWKPSEEQLISLGRFIEGVYGCVDFMNIKLLYNELKLL